MGLTEQVKEVYELRKSLSEMQEQKKKLLAEWETQHKGLLEQIVYSGTVLANAETVLREMTVQAYQETGEKQPCAGVAVREVTRLDYDPKEALKWAMSHHIALSLDKKTFEGFAKTTPLDFVRISKELQATIATDLSKVLSEKGEG